MRKNGKTVYVFEPVLWDIVDARSYTPDPGTLVQKTQPFGCPKNGTMGHCYIATMEGEFLGLVHQNSLRPATKADAAKAVETAEQTAARLEREYQAGHGHVDCDGQFVPAEETA